VWAADVVAWPTYAVMLTLLAASATVIGFLVLHQVPRPHDLLRIGLVIGGRARHREPASRPTPPLTLASAWARDATS